MTSMAATISQGYNARMEPQLSAGGGVYRLTNIMIDRSYAVEVRTLLVVVEQSTFDFGNPVVKNHH